MCQSNIRTIQRIEQGAVVPRLFTLKLLSEVLEFDFNSGKTQEEYVIVSFLRRAVAFILDQVILAIARYIILCVSAVVTLPDIIKQLEIALPLFFFLSASYYIMCWNSSEGATVGMMIFKIKVLQSDFSRITFLQSIKRYFGSLISMIPFFLGFLWVLFDKKHQGWHDKLAGTLVVEK